MRRTIIFLLLLFGSAVSYAQQRSGSQSYTPEQRMRMMQQRERQNQINAASRPDNVAERDNPFNNSLIPITDLAGKYYQGVAGGLYPGGSNERPEPYASKGIEAGRNIVPLDVKGRKDGREGRVVWLSVGMSNTTQSTRVFIEAARNLPGLNPKLDLIDGAFGGQDINRILNPENPYWENIVRQRLTPVGLTPEQVQVVWFKEAEARASDTTFVSYVPALAVKYKRAVGLIRKHFPNVRIIYMSPRAYAGYAKTRLNPEPFAWYTGWAIKQVVGEYIEKSPAGMPWLTWGPYLWSNGMTPNAQGLISAESDYGPDGTHPSPEGQEKIARLLIDHFSGDPTAAAWFLGK